MKNNRKKVVIDALLFTAILGLTLYAVFHGQDLGAIADAIHDVDERWLKSWGWAGAFSSPRWAFSSPP